MEKETPDEFNLMVNDYEETPTEEWEKFLPTERELEKVGDHYWGGDYSPSLLELMNLRQSYKEILAPKLKEALSSHDAELRRKIEKFIDENDDGMWAGRETADAVLVLLGKENV